MADENTTANRPSPLSSITNGSEVRNIEDINAIDRMLWWCCGADPKILERCNYSDRVKYFGLGGIVLATGVLAFVAMFFAVNVIFFTGDYTAQGVIVPFLIALLWGCIIFNLDRFIVSSTGKGDGTEKITSSEFIAALPRMIMAIVIALSISAPLEIKLFEEEINKTFNEKNEALVIAQKTEYEKSNADDVKLILNNIKIKQSEKKVQDEIYKKNEALVAYEIITGCKGKCNEYKELRDNAEKKIIELKNEIDALEIKKGIIDKERNDKLAIFKDKINAKPGLLERILLLEETKGASGPIWIVRFLFIIIELGPIFFKMMLTKSTYDHLKHYEDELRLAEFGIFEDERLIPGSEHGIAEKFYVYGNAEKLQHENRILHTEQQRMDQEIVRTWQNYVAEQMTNSPEKFIEFLQKHGSFPMNVPSVKENTDKADNNASTTDHNIVVTNKVEPAREPEPSPNHDPNKEPTLPIVPPENQIIPFEISDNSGKSITIDVTEDLTEFA